MKTIITFALSLFALSSLALAAEPPKVGDKAPEFSLKDGSGQTVSLKDYKGKWVVLYFYPKNFTSGCTKEAHGFQADQEKYRKAKAVVLGVSVDDEASHKDFCAKEGLTFKTLSDADKKVSEAYGSLMDSQIGKISQRNTFIIDPKGRIAKVYVSVDPNKHSEEVLAALAELNPPKKRGY
jgi:peroxiredoxin Q/BCP